MSATASVSLAASGSPVTKKTRAPSAEDPVNLTVGVGPRQGLGGLEEDARAVGRGPDEACVSGSVAVDRALRQMHRASVAEPRACFMAMRCSREQTRNAVPNSSTSMASASSAANDGTPASRTASASGSFAGAVMV